MFQKKARGRGTQERRKEGVFLRDRVDTSVGLPSVLSELSPKICRSLAAQGPEMCLICSRHF